MPPPVARSVSPAERSCTATGTPTPSSYAPFALIIDSPCSPVFQPIWAIAGIAYGMVELIRRVIPADICGGDVMRLRRMGVCPTVLSFELTTHVVAPDATVHILYEVAGTAGAFASSSAISRFGNNTSYFLSPVFFTFAAVFWWFIIPTPKALRHKEAALSDVERPTRSKNYFTQILLGTYLFGKSVWVGAKLIFGHRKVCCPPPRY